MSERGEQADVGGPDGDEDKSGDDAGRVAGGAGQESGRAR
jgi:hypothetical protein